MSKIQKLYNYIEVMYGKRGAWISDIASQLEISSEKANMLTYAAGYRRGKKSVPIQSQQFCTDTRVVFIASMIEEQKIILE